MSVSVCLSECMFVCLYVYSLAYLKNDMSRLFQFFFCTLHVLMLLSDDSAIRYVLPVLWMTLCFHIGEAKMDVCSKWLTGVASGAKSDVYDCVVFVTGIYRSSLTFCREHFSAAIETRKVAIRLRREAVKSF